MDFLITTGNMGDAVIDYFSSGKENAGHKQLADLKIPFILIRTRLPMFDGESYSAYQPADWVR